MNNHSKAVCDIIHALLSKPDQVNELGQMLDSGRQSETGNQRPEMPVPRADLFPTSSTRSHGVENEVRSLFSRKSPQFHYTRSSVRKRNAYPAKATQSNVRGPLTFIKELILLSGPNIDNVLKQGKKQELHEVGHIVNAFEFNKYWSEEEVYENVRKAFSMKLEDDIEYVFLFCLFFISQHRRCSSLRLRRGGSSDSSSVGQERPPIQQHTGTLPQPSLLELQGQIVIHRRINTDFHDQMLLEVRELSSTVRQGMCDTSSSVAQGMNDISTIIGQGMQTIAALLG
ncbi:uncharacterized protein LOC134944167 [Pseudophryne corroboree]|uniref:uncharacterized protein LOC134944167 n=1 Tax=Pseudophryne corroboree TaxID=495146 RepID=UPI00308162A8